MLDEVLNKESLHRQNLAASQSGVLFDRGRKKKYLVLFQDYLLIACYQSNVIEMQNNI